jgi:aspartyl/asparaginyl-tRNA synthetase
MDQFIEFVSNFLKTFFTNLFKLDVDKIIDKLGRGDFIKNIINKEFKVLKHADAIDMLNAAAITKADSTAFSSHDDIPEAQERKLIDDIGSVVMLSHFPIMTKAFYTAADNADKTRALAVDVEFPNVGEIMGCSLRETRREVLEAKLELFTLRDICDDIINVASEHNLDTVKINKYIFEQDTASLKQEMLGTIDSIKLVDNSGYSWDGIIDQINNIPYNDYEWYFKLRDYGFGMTGGFGLGVERMVTWLSGGEKVDGEYNYSIHSVSTFPRTVDRICP